MLTTGWHGKIEEVEMKQKRIDFIVHKPFEVEQVLNLVQEGMVLREPV